MMEVKFYHETRLPSKQYIIVITMDDGQRFTWQSESDYSNRWRYISDNVAITRFSDEINSSEFPIENKRQAVAILFDSFIER